LEALALLHAPEGVLRKSVKRAVEILGVNTGNFDERAAEYEIVNAHDSDGWTPLLTALSQGNGQVGELLIAKGADVNAVNKEGMTPLHWAAHKGLSQIAELLIAKGANVNVANINDAIPLHFALYNGHGQVGELLIAKGADVNATNKDGSTPLHYAPDIQVGELLIAKGADVNATNKDGRTPLHYAPDIQVAELLIAKGADVNAANNDGWTPLHLALYKGLSQVAELLIAKGADVNATMKGNRKALLNFPGLQCPLCKRVYIIGVDASVITTQTLAALSGATISFTDGPSSIQTSVDRPALVGMLRRDDPTQKSLIEASAAVVGSIRQSLIAGKKEYWYCAECKQNPPLEFPASWILVES
jgi:hypothetical protein